MIFLNTLTIGQTNQLFWFFNKIMRFYYYKLNIVNDF